MSNRAIERLSATKKLLLATATASVIIAPVCIGVAIPPAAVAQTTTGTQSQMAADAPYGTVNFKDADITMVAEAVGAATGKNFIIDPRVSAQVTLLTTTPLTPTAFYQTFLSILEVYGFNAEQAGDVIKIVPDANAKQHPVDDASSTNDAFVTEVVEVKNVRAAQLIPILRPMLPQYGQLAAYPASNILIISDRASNVNRMIRVIHAIDQAGTNLGTPPQSGGAA